MIPGETEKRRFRDSVAVKIAIIGGLILMLLIPLGMVSSLVSERQAREKEATKEVADSWGRPQMLSGPVLTVPYLEHVKDAKGKEIGTQTYWVRFLPETLKIEGNVETEKRNRGIFEVAVYRTGLHWTGTFQRPSFDEWHVEPKDVLWRDAYLSIGVPDMRGITSGVGLTWGSRPLQLSPGGAEDGLWHSGLRVGIPDLAAGKAEDVYAFAFDLTVNGSESLSFVPLGKETTVALKSNWPSPSFCGEFLPARRTVHGTGFDARWNVSWFGRNYPQQWRTSDVKEHATAAQLSPTGRDYPRELRASEAKEQAPAQALDDSAFGVQLFQPVDAYQKTERSTKYAALFLVLTFLTFFLYEQFNPFSLHPVQYLLVGFALCLFYLLLLSISEHAPFGLAYLAAAAATVLLIGGYSAAILRGALRALLMTFVLGTLYGYLYVLLQLEDYALLLGSFGLFVILALVMYLTRRIDWASPRRTPLPVTATVTNP
ncbi:MAG TPA: cell envelope integrity protein CreD [Thermoanaerobaculia bacterium]|nr:cell envelope integrity protein CreD [Thermoanaerobaculia bacterium]